MMGGVKNPPGEKKMTNLQIYRPWMAVAALAVWTSVTASAQYTFVKIKVPAAGADAGTPFAISNQNDIAGVYGIKGERRTTLGYLRTSDNQWVYLTDPVPGQTLIAPQGVNSNRTVVGYYRPSKGLASGFLFNGGSYLFPFNEPGCKDTEVSGIDDSSDIAGSCFESGKSKAWFYINNTGTTTFFTVPGAADTYAAAINSAGQVAGSYTGGPHIVGYVRTSTGEITTYDQGVPTWVFGLSDISNRDDRWVAGYYENPDGTFHGFLNLNGTNIPIDAPGAKSTLVFGVNVKGWFVGTYVDAQGHGHGYYGKPSNGASVLVDEE
jgi:hypothetical protein